MRILLISMYYKPDTAATGLLMAELVEDLAQRGHDVTVITSMPHYTTNSVWPEYRRRFRVFERHGSIKVHRLFTYVPANKDRLVPRFLSYLSFTALSSLHGLWEKRPDVILIPSPSPPLTNGVAAYLLSRLRGIPIVSNVQDIYPDVAIRMGVMKNPLIIAGYKKLERFVYARSAAVTVISDGFRRNLIAKDVPEEKIRVIPNFIAADFVSPQPRRNAFSAEHGLDDRFVALFAGNVGMSQGLETVLDAAALLRSHPDILFLIVGNGAAKPALQAQAEQRGLDNVRFLPYQPYERVPELYSAADVGLIPLRRGFTNDSVPSKMFTIMGVARPLIAGVDEESETAQVVAESRCGLCARPEDPQSLAEAVLTMYNCPREAAQMGLRGRAHVEAYYTRAAVANQYQDLFLQVTAKATPVSRPHKADAKI